MCSSAFPLCMSESHHAIHRLQVNHLSISLLTILLLPSLMRGDYHEDARPRVVMVSSDAHSLIPDLGELQGENIFQKLSDKAYCTKSKLLHNCI